MKKGTAYLITGLLLIAAAFALTGYNIRDDKRAGNAADTVLAQMAENMSFEDGDAPAEAADGPDTVLDPNREMPVAQIDGDDYIGVISLPAIDRELPVFSEWNYSNLKISACRYTGSAYLGSMVICAHNYASCFGSLRRLNYGDPIIFTDMDGNEFNYRVIEIETLQPTAIEEMTGGDWDLTLFTCTVGGAARVAVRCEKVGF